MVVGARVAAHGHLFVHGHSPVHALPPEAKLVGLAAFVAVLAMTPRDSVHVIAADLAIVIVVFRVAALPRAVLARSAVILPFVAFAVAVPFVADGATTEVLGVGVATDGLWAAWNIVAKAWLGATAGIIVSATTTVPEVLDGLSRLRAPRPMVAIAAFMFRYLDLLTEQLGRMRSAMTARGHDPRWLWQVRPIAASAGVLFVRSYERGERIHQAMLARGFGGEMPDLHPSRPTGGQWAVATLPAIAATLALTASSAGWPS